MKEIDAIHILSFFPKGRQVLALHGTAVAALTDPICSGWENLSSWKEDLAHIKNNGINLIPYTDERYPKALLKFPDYPLVLYVKGEILNSDHSGIAITGTQECSFYGKDMTRRIAEEVAASGLTVISGLNRGIDTAAHLGALRTGRTLAISSSGLLHLENPSLASHIAHQGAVISEFPMNTPTEAIPFQKRTRLLNIFSQALLLTEAPRGSTAAKIATSFNKKCFILPCHANEDLLHSGKATLVQNVQEILSSLTNTTFSGSLNG